MLPAKQPTHNPAPTDPELGVDASTLTGALHDVSNALTLLLHWLGEAHVLAQSGANPTEAIESAMRQAKHGREIVAGAMGTSSASNRTVGTSNWVLFAKQVAQDLKALQGSSRLTLTIPLQTHLVPVVKPSAARQVLTNLLLNAIAATEPNGHVRWSATPHGDHFVRFLVEDDGPGFSDTQRQRLFSGIRSTKHAGQGHGLRHAHALTQEVGGTLKPLAVHPHTTFELTWPLETAVDERDASRMQQRHVLLIEDDAAIQQLLRLKLERERMQVHACVCWEEALTWLQGSQPIDLLLTDLSPLGPRPAELLAYAREHTSGPIVLLTGTPNIPNDIGDNAVEMIVHKPFEVGELLGQLEVVIGEYSRANDR